MVDATVVLEDPSSVYSSVVHCDSVGAKDSNRMHSLLKVSARLFKKVEFLGKDSSDILNRPWATVAVEIEECIALLHCKVSHSSAKIRRLHGPRLTGRQGYQRCFFDNAGPTGNVADSEEPEASGLSVTGLEKRFWYLNQSKYAHGADPNVPLACVSLPIFALTCLVWISASNCVCLSVPASVGLG